MKPAFLLPPVIALVIAGTWLGSQRRSISTLENDCAVLRKAIDARAPALSAGGFPSGKPASIAKPALSIEPRDWKDAAAMLEAGEMRAMMKWQQRLKDMSTEELLAAFDEIAALDLPPDDRQMLEEMLLDPLFEKDPGLALTEFVERLENDQAAIGLRLATAMEEWANKDAFAAAAWLDQQTNAGKFDSKTLDGKCRIGSLLEVNLIRVLLRSDAGAASRRLAAMTEEQRATTLAQFSSQPLKGDDLPALAKLIRAHVPEKNQARALAQQVFRFDDFSEVTDFLDRIQATPAERIACVEQAAENRMRSFSQRITREDLNAMREWVSTQAPDSIGSVTGKVLSSGAQGSSKMDFSEAAALAEEYNAAAGNDEVLSAFLGGWLALKYKGESKELAEKISDAILRQEILKKLQ